MQGIAVTNTEDVKVTYNSLNSWKLIDDLVLRHKWYVIKFQLWEQNQFLCKHIFKLFAELSNESWLDIFKIPPGKNNRFSKESHLVDESPTYPLLYNMKWWLK